MTYQVAAGHDNAGALADLAPQPATPNSLQQPALVTAGDGTSSTQGFPFMELFWTKLTRAEYNAIRAAFGFTDTVYSAPVTVNIRLPDDTFTNKNAQAKQAPRSSRAMPFWSNIAVQLIHLQDTA